MFAIIYRTIFILLLTVSVSLGAHAQDKQAPLTSQEFVQMVQQLPRSAAMKEQLITAIRERGLGFTITNGLRSLVATKSGNDPELRRTLEEAERRRANPTASTLPPSAEGIALWENARQAADAAAERMPDFTVKQIINRYHSPGGLNNWTLDDRLTVAVSYRAEGSEDYKLLAINDVPYTKESRDGRTSYTDAGGTSSTGEFVTVLKSLFAPASQTAFRLVDTDTLQQRRTLVYEYEVKTENSQQRISAPSLTERVIVTGFRGRVWIDRETYRVLRLESEAIDIPTDYPVTAASRVIDYAPVMIGEREFHLPVRADVRLAVRVGREKYYSRNDIRFRGYRRFGAEVRIIEDDDVPVTEEPTPPPPPPRF